MQFVKQVREKVRKINCNKKIETIEFKIIKQLIFFSLNLL